MFRDVERGGAAGRRDGRVLTIAIIVEASGIADPTSTIFRASR
jgi:hypothetical protein